MLPLQGLYAAIGIAQYVFMRLQSADGMLTAPSLRALFTFCMGASMGILSYFASGNLYNDALHNLFHAPMYVFDTTPLGRIMGVFGKDVSVGEVSPLSLDV